MKFLYVACACTCQGARSYSSSNQIRYRSPISISRNFLWCPKLTAITSDSPHFAGIISDFVASIFSSKIYSKKCTYEVATTFSGSHHAGPWDYVQQVAHSKTVKSSISYGTGSDSLLQPSFQKSLVMCQRNCRSNWSRYHTADPKLNWV